MRENRPAAFLAWAREMFGPVALVRSERLLRFVEEAIELAHADGMERAIFNKVADRVYSREPGDIPKEIGQAQACLETYAENMGLSSTDQAEREWQRVQTIPKDDWQKRHAAKQILGIALSNPDLNHPGSGPPVYGKKEDLIQGTAADASPSSGHPGSESANGLQLGATK